MDLSALDREVREKLARAERERDAKPPYTADTAVAYYRGQRNIIRRLRAQEQS